MTFIEMQRELSERLRAYDETISADATKLKRWLNLAQREISGEWNWPFLQGIYILQTVTEISTGTLTATNGSTSITFSSAPTPSVANRYIQTSDSDDWYEITSHTAGATAATLTQAYLGTGGASLTYKVRQFYYALPSDMDRVIAVAQAITPRKVISLNHQEYDRNLVFTDATGKPEAYFMYSADSSYNWKMGFYPTPDSTLNVWIKYVKRVTDMSADADPSIIGAKYDDVLLDLASFYGFSALDDSRGNTFYQKYLIGLERMKRTCKQDLGTVSIMQAVDEGGNGNHPLWRLPPEYGPIVY